MAKKKKALAHQDRVRHRGEVGTVVSVHDGAVTVLPDDRPRSKGALVWRSDDCELIPRVMGCPRCSSRHLIFYCPEGA